MGWWNGKYTRYEVWFGYEESRIEGGIHWTQQMRHGRNVGMPAAQAAKDLSKEFSIYARVFDHHTSKLVAEFYKGEPHISQVLPAEATKASLLGFKTPE